jgi:hypothetical protein
MSINFAKQHYQSSEVGVQYVNTLNDNVIMTPYQLISKDKNLINLTLTNNFNNNTVIVPKNTNKIINLFFTTKQGPVFDLSLKRFYGSVSVVFKKQIQNEILFDTIALIYGLDNYEKYDSGVHISDTIPHINMVCQKGEIVYGTTTIDFDSTIDNIIFGPMDNKNGFSLYDVEHKPKKKIVTFKFTSEKLGTFTSEYYFKYRIRLFNGTYIDSIFYAPIILTSKVQSPLVATKNDDSVTINIYPNPASESVTLDFYREIMIHDIQAINIIGASRPLSAHIEGSHAEIDLRQLPIGHYTLNIRHNWGISVIPLVVMR